MDGRPLFLDVPMDPPHLSEVLLIPFSIVDDEIPSSVLLILTLWGTGFSNTGFLSRQGEMTKLVTS